jgi:PEP-CTERM motif
MSLRSILAVAFSLLLVASVSADDVTVNHGDLDGVGQSFEVEVEHYDSDPFKGALIVNVTNASGVSWGDFHFQIFQIPGQDPIDNVFFYDNIVGDEPSSSQTLDTPGWAISDGGHVIDLYYYGDPVAPTESASFTVYTDNTTDNVNFGVSFWATAVPEPATMTLLGAGLLGMVIRRKKA